MKEGRRSQDLDQAIGTHRNPAENGGPECTSPTRSTENAFLKMPFSRANSLLTWYGVEAPKP